MVGDRTIGISNNVNRETHHRSASHEFESSLSQRAKRELATAGMGVRVPIRAVKRGNARGAKGHRKIDRERTDSWKTNWN